MATLSPSTQDFSTIPSQILPSSNVTVAVASRRLPPPCWSHEETIALIDAYRDKWYSLRKGNLRANHWQEVADDVGSGCPLDPPKTAVQCRHKMEKLRKRYRAEIQRAAPYGGARSHRYCSAWVHFKRMHMMGRGPNAFSPPLSDDEADEDVEDYHQNSVKLVGVLYGNNVNTGNRSSFPGVVSNGGGGFRIRIPAMPGSAPPMAKPYSRYEDSGVKTPNNFGSSKIFRDGFVKKADWGKGLLVEEWERRERGIPWRKWWLR